MGSAFALGPGGKGSNQAVAAARAGASVTMLSKLGNDAFAQLARGLWTADRIDHTRTPSCTTPTGAAAILLDQHTGQNAIIIVPGACFTLTPAEVDTHADAIASASILLTQLELPLDTVARGLEIAHAAGVTTVLNPAPAQPLPRSILALANFLIPNETEAALLAGLPVTSLAEAETAARALQAAGARHVILTLGENGALLLLENTAPAHIPAFHPAPVVETTGAGDAFCGAFAAALAEGRSPLAAVTFACAAASLSVTRPGTAPSMPRRDEILALLP